MIELYRGALENAGRIIGGVDPSAHGRATPCDEFTVKDLMNHIIHGTQVMAALGNGEQRELGGPAPDFTAEGFANAFAHGMKLAVEAWSRPEALERTYTFSFGERPGARVLAIGVNEAVVHGWDLATATGQAHGIDPNVAALLYEGLKANLPASVRGPGGPYGPEVPVPDGADAVTKLVAFLGRTP